jgi:hypothetical protein
MKMLRWGYVHPLLAFALLFLVAPNVNAAIYSSHIEAKWKISSLEVEVLGTFIAPTDAVDITANAYQDDDFSGSVIEGLGTASFGTVTTVIGDPEDMDVDNLISLEASASGDAPSAVSSASSEAMAVGSLSFFNPFQPSQDSDLLVTVELDLLYSYELSADALTADESAEAGVEIKIFDDTSTIFSNTVFGQAPFSDSDAPDLFTYSFILGGRESRELFLSTSAYGAASFAASDNSGGGPGGSDDPAAVPEPSTIAIWSLFGVVGLTVGAVRRRRSK